MCFSVLLQETVFENPVRVLSQSQVKEMKLKFYNTDIHRVSFALPQFVKDVSHEYIHKMTMCLRMSVLGTPTYPVMQKS